VRRALGEAARLLGLLEEDLAQEAGDEPVEGILAGLSRPMEEYFDAGIRVQSMLSAFREARVLALARLVTGRRWRALTWFCGRRP
jgi:hypothetical protein